MGVLLFVLAILVIVMVHEAGHFVAAKAFGFKATKFYVGFGPPLLKFRRGETEYGIAAIPAGGFVKIVGMNPYEEVAPEDEPRSYPNKPAWQRAIVLFAGAATHWPMAFVLMLVATMVVGFPTDPTNQVSQVSREIQGQPAPAAVAGFKEGDRVVEVDGEATDTWAEVSAAIRRRADQLVTFTVVRDGETMDREVRLGTAIFSAPGEGPCAYFGPGHTGPREAPAGCEGRAVGFLGLTPSVLYERLPPGEAVTTSAQWVGETTVQSFKGVGLIFSQVFNGDLFAALSGEGEREADEGPIGIVGAGRIANQTVAEGQFLNFLGLLVGFTIFVGLMNLLPLPPLDGGHLAVLVWEKITGKRVDMRKLIPVAAAVIAFFVVLFVAVLYLDLARPVRVPF